jgi:hypothetical protein
VALEALFFEEEQNIKPYHNNMLMTQQYQSKGMKETFGMWSIC